MMLIFLVAFSAELIFSLYILISVLHELNYLFFFYNFHHLNFMGFRGRIKMNQRDEIINTLCNFPSV